MGIVARQDILRQLADAIVSVNRSHPLRVAIDGIDAAGKTMLADELAPLIKKRGRFVFRASIDGFHRPRHERYRRGSDSPEGYYEDSFDYEALRDFLLLPLGPNGNRHYRCAVFDVRTDTPLSPLYEDVPPNAVLLFDGVFLLRPELQELWDYRIFVSVDFKVALERALERALSLFASQEAVHIRYLQRYIPGQELYLRVAQPQKRADVVVENNDLMHPGLVFSSLDSAVQERQ